MTTTKFLRRTWTRFSRLGKGRKKKQKWREAKGRHSKTREMRRGYPAIVKIGYRQSTKEKPAVIYNISQLEGKKEIILGKIGKKKKIEIAERAKEKKIQIVNLNIEKFLKLNKKIEKVKEKKWTLERKKN